MHIPIVRIDACGSNAELVHVGFANHDSSTFP